VAVLETDIAKDLPWITSWLGRVGAGSFVLAAVFALGYLASRKVRLDRVSEKALRLGFPPWTLYLLLGSIQDDRLTGRFWNGEPATSGRLVLWLFFALVLRLPRRNAKTAMATVLGSLIVLFVLRGLFV
jgi:ABC-type transport system involved in cytochrome c biogenesis permease subunit